LLLPAAETLATVDSWIHGSAFPRYDFLDAWRELLVFHEHTASSGPGWPHYFTRWQTDWNNVAHYAAAMGGYSNARQLLDKAATRFAGSTGLFDPAHKTQETEATVLVFNGLSWARGGPVTVDKLPSALRDGPLEVLDRATGKVIPSEDVPGTERHIVFFASTIPSMGYRLFLIRRASALANIRETLRIQVKVDDAGWIRSLVDKSSGAEMVDAKSERPFGSLYISRKNSNYQAAPVSPPEARTVDGAVTRRIEVIRKDSALRRTLVTLYRDASYADLTFDVDLTALDESSIRYAIAFPLTGKQLWLDGPGNVVRIPNDLLPGGGAPQYTPLHFSHFSQTAQSGITLANRDAFLFRPDRLFLVASEGLTAQTRDEGTQRLFRTEPRSSNIQSFRFRIGVHREKVVEWKQFGLELNLPLQTTVVFSTNLAVEQSFFSLSHDSVRITAFKPAESQSGWHILRFQEMGGQTATKVRLTSQFRILEASIANTVEVPSAVKIDLSSFDLRPWESMTVLVKLQR